MKKTVVQFFKHGMRKNAVLVFMFILLGTLQLMAQNKANNNKTNLVPDAKVWNFEHRVLQDYFTEPDPQNGECAIVDINNDGHPDLWWGVCAFKNETWDQERYMRQKDLSQMAWYKGPQFVEIFRMYNGVTHGANWVDLDNDGDMDCVTGCAIGSHELIWLENPGNPENTKNWPYHRIWTGDIDPDMTLFADLNKDGRQDIIIQSLRQDVFFLLTPSDPKDGQWKLYHAGNNDAGQRTGASLGDINGDGNMDIIWGYGWLENPGNPVEVPWKDHIIDPRIGADQQSVAVDLDGDEKPEVILAGEESFDGAAWYKWEPLKKIWIKNQIAPPVEYSGLHSLRVADFDGDGDLDVFTAEMHMSGYIKQVPPHKVTVFENVEISRNIWKEHILAVTGTHNARVGDINGDGKPDIVGSNWNTWLKDYPLKAELWLNEIK